MASPTEQEVRRVWALKDEGLSQRKIADALGWGHTQKVRNILRGDRPDSDPGAPREPPSQQPPELDGDDPGGRAAERQPSRPPGAPVHVPATVDYGKVASYIEGLYVMGAKGVERANPVACTVITNHAKPAGKAWADWIRSEPSVAAWIERLMIGTPLGEVIGVHFSMVVAYVFAQRLAADAAAAAAAGGDGSAEPPA